MSDIRLALALSLAIFPGTSLAQTATPQQKSTIQQQFDAGTVAKEAGDWQKAYDIYSQLETALAARTPPSKNLGIVSLRKALMLYRLGKRNDGETAIIAALAKLDIKDPTLFGDRIDAYLRLADADERRFDYVAAIAKLETALAVGSDDGLKLIIYSSLIPIRIFVDAQAALTDADAALAVLARNPNANEEWGGVMLALRGRVLTNLGRLKEARYDLKKAVDRLGGLVPGKFNVLDASARADASIAAMRDNDPDQGRRFLAYTGSAQASKQGFRLGADMEPPACGGINGPKREDVAVVELSIGSDGGVGLARPVYYSGAPEVAVQFARAVSTWYWDAAELSQVQPIYRVLTRLEMRCTTSFQRSNPISLLLPAVNDWLDATTVQPANLPAGGSNKDSLAALNATMLTLARRDGADTVAMIKPLMLLSQHPLIPFDVARNYLSRAFELAKKAKAPPVVYAYLATQLAGYEDGRSERRIRTKYLAALDDALADPLIGSDPVASSAVRLSLFDAFDATARKSRAEKILRPIVNELRLTPNDPFKVGALSRLANVAIDKGNADEARSLYAQTGLSAQQCALVDARPAVATGKLSNDDFPLAAARYGFGGWTVIEFDIDANGRTANRRPIIAWPPFIFGDAATEGISSFRFQQSYRPEGGLGCGAQRQRINFLPG